MDDGWTIFRTQETKLCSAETAETSLSLSDLTGNVRNREPATLSDLEKLDSLEEAAVHFMANLKPAGSGRFSVRLKNAGISLKLTEGMYLSQIIILFVTRSNNRPFWTQMVAKCKEPDSSRPFI